MRKSCESFESCIGIALGLKKNVFVQFKVVNCAIIRWLRKPKGRGKLKGRSQAAKKVQRIL